MTAKNKNKKGMLQELLIIIVVPIIMIFFFALWGYGMNQVSSVIVAIPSDSTQNISDAGTQIFAPVARGMDVLPTVAVMILLGYIIALFITGYLTSKHPIWYIVYFVIIILFTIFSIYVSNAFEKIMGDASLAVIVENYGAISYFILNLPWIIATLGFFGIVVMLIARYIGGDEALQ